MATTKKWVCGFKYNNEVVCEEVEVGVGKKELKVLVASPDAQRLLRYVTVWRSDSLMFSDSREEAIKRALDLCNRECSMLRQDHAEAQCRSAIVHTMLINEQYKNQCDHGETLKERTLRNE